jgi:hypothetical protein
LNQRGFCVTFSYEPSYRAANRRNALARKAIHKPRSLAFMDTERLRHIEADAAVYCLDGDATSGFSRSKESSRESQ